MIRLKWNCPALLESLLFHGDRSQTDDQESTNTCLLESPSYLKPVVRGKLKPSYAQNQGLPISIKIPAFNDTVIQYPKLDLLQSFKEDELERYSRTNSILKSLQCVLAPTKWRETFVNAKSSPYASTLISADMIPSWMRPEEPQDDLSITIASVEPTELIRKSFILYLNRQQKTKYSSKLDKHVQEFIVFNGLRLPESNVQVERDPRAYPTGEMWRDTLRRQLHFEQLRVDFLTMSLTVRNTVIPIRELLIYDLNHPSTAASWSEVQEFLAKKDVDEFIFSYTLHVIEEHEDFDYEHDGPLLAILKDIQVTEDNDVAVRSVIDPVSTRSIDEAYEKMSQTSQALEDTMPMQNDPENMNPSLMEGSYSPSLHNKLRQFLSDGSTIARKKSIPQSYFDSTQRSEMLLYHENFEVFTEEGLLRWQHHVLDKVCGQMPKALKDNSILKLNKKVREELQQAQTDSETALLSAEVFIQSHISLKLSLTCLEKPDSVHDLKRYFDIQNAFTERITDRSTYCYLQDNTRHEVHFEARSSTAT